MDSACYFDMSLQMTEDGIWDMATWECSIPVHTRAFEGVLLTVPFRALSDCGPIAELIAADTELPYRGLQTGLGLVGMASGARFVPAHIASESGAGLRLTKGGSL